MFHRIIKLYVVIRELSPRPYYAVHLPQQLMRRDERADDEWSRVSSEVSAAVNYQLDSQRH